MDAIYIKVDGREVRIFKRKGFDCFYIRLNVGGRNRERSLKTADLKKARKKAEVLAGKIFDEADAQRLGVAAPAAESRMDVSVTECIGLFEAYREGVGKKIAKRTISQYISQLKGILDHAFPGRRHESIMIGELADPAAVEKWRRKMYELYSDFDFEEDLDLNGTLNSSLHQARGVFSKDAVIDIYTKHGIIIPMRVLPGRDLDPPDKRFVEIAPEVDAQMQNSLHPEHANWPGAKTAVMCEMARFCGMTRKEIQHFEWSWMETDIHERLVIVIKRRANFRSKGNYKNREIPVDPARAAKWKQWLEQDETHSGPALGGVNWDKNYKAASAWVNSFLKREKTLHELRKQAITDMLKSLKNEGANPAEMLKQAADFAGNSVQVIIDHYLTRTHNIKAL